MFSSNVVAFVALGVALAGMRSSNFIFRGLSSTIITVLVFVCMIAATGIYIGHAITEPSALAGLVPPEAVSTSSDDGLGRGAIVDLDGSVCPAGHARVPC